MIVLGRTPGGVEINHDDVGRLFATLECALIDRRRLATQNEARMANFEFIEGLDNPRRRHSSIRYLSPIDFERIQLPPGRPSH